MTRDAARVFLSRTACLVLAAATLLQARSSHPASEAAPDVFFPVPQDEQRLAGIFAVRMRANVEGYLEHVDPPALLASPVSAGLFLIASSDAYAYSGDAQLKRVMERVARAVVKAPFPSEDPRAQASLISGLVAFSEETGEEEGLAAARKLADACLPQGSPILIGPLINLYRASDDERYLQAAKTLSRKSAPSQDLDRFLFFNGLLNYYRQTGEDSALHKSAQAWHAVHPTATGGPEGSGDTTLTAVWFEWTRNLLRATGQIEYAEALETTLYNQLLAAQETQSGAVYGTVPSAGEKQRAGANTVCATAEAWALAGLPEAIWGRMNNAVVLFNYSPGRASFRLRRRNTVQIYAEGQYPESSDLTLHVEPSRETRFPLILRVPRWSRKFTVESGESKQIGKPGELLTFTKDWKKGDTVHITIDQPVRELSDPDQPTSKALMRGPQILAVRAATPAAAPELNVAAWSKDSAGSVRDKVGSRGTADTMFEQRFETDGVVKGAATKLLLVPFADAEGTYRVWLPKG